MKRVTTLFFAFTMLMSFSCKDNKGSNIEPKESIDQVAKETFSDDFTFVLKAKVGQKDTFQIFYIQDPSEAYNDKEFVSVEVSPNDEFQNIEFRLPNNVYPHNLRLDIGVNKAQASIQIEKLTLIYKSGTYLIEGKDLPNYFFLNEGIVVDPGSSTFTLKTFEKNGSEVYDPYMVGNPELNNIIYSEL